MPRYSYLHQISEIIATRNCVDDTINQNHPHYFEGYDDVFRYRYNPHTDEMWISIRSIAGWRWFTDTDMIVYRVSRKEISDIFRWANIVLENKQYNSGFGAALEYPSKSLQFKNKKNNLFRIHVNARKNYTCKTTQTSGKRK